MDRSAKLVATCVSLLLLGVPVPVAAEDSATASAALRQLNESAAAIYQDAKRRYLAIADPVVIVGFDSMLIRQHGSVKRVAQTPTAYAALKAIGHLPRSLWAALRPAIDGLDRDDRWRGELTELRLRAVAAAKLLPEAGLSSEAAKRAGDTLRACIELIDRSLADGPPDRAVLQQEMRMLAPALLADTAEAAVIQLDAIDRDLRPWWKGLSEAERGVAFVVVLGPKTARVGNVAYNYFVNLLGAAEDGHRVVYAEGVFDEEGADRLIATLVTDRRLAEDLFADERRMERDALADGATARLLQMFGRLGKP